MSGRNTPALLAPEVCAVLACFEESAGHVAAEDVRQVHAGQAFAHTQVEVVQRASADADEDLIFTRLGIGDVLVHEDFGSTELVNADDFHGAPATSGEDSNFTRSHKLHFNFLTTGITGEILPWGRRSVY